MKHHAWLISLAISVAASAVMAQQTSAPIVDLRQAPVSPSVLTDSKKDDAAVLFLRAAAREKATNPNTNLFEHMLQTQKTRDSILMSMLAPDSALTHAAAKALKAKLGGFLTNNVAPQHADAIALQMVQSIFLNRRDDLASIQSLYDDKNWQDAMRARFEKGEVPELNVTLSADKRTELQNTALYIHTPGKEDGKIEPTVHIFLTALAQQIGHDALAEITKPGTKLHKQFLDTLAKALPSDEGEKAKLNDEKGAKAWLNEWLYLREGRAAAVAKEFRPDSALMQDAVAKSETKRRSRMKDAPAVWYER